MQRVNVTQLLVSPPSHILISYFLLLHNVMYQQAKV